MTLHHLDLTLVVLVDRSTKIEREANDIELETSTAVFELYLV